MQKRTGNFYRTAIAVLFLFRCQFLPFLPVFSAVAAEPPKELVIASFSTRFSEDNAPRAHNIRLACQLLNGVRIGGGEMFSFNERVGARTSERGFENAAVILQGEFVEGIGGGVCQVSTTVYNAALLAGMDIAEVHAHSLQVRYVLPSFDAMVSAESDLKFVNPRRTPAVLFARAEDGALTVELYGKGDGFFYRTESVVTGRVQPGPPQTVEGDEDAVLREEKEGVKSEGYLVQCRRGRTRTRTRIRRDFYAPVRAVLQTRRREEEKGEEKTEIFDNKFDESAQNN